MAQPTIISEGGGHLEFEYTVRKESLNHMNNLHGGVTPASIDDILGAMMFSSNNLFRTDINRK